MGKVVDFIQENVVEKMQTKEESCHQQLVNAFTTIVVKTLDGLPEKQRVPVAERILREYLDYKGNLTTDNDDEDEIEDENQVKFSFHKKGCKEEFIVKVEGGVEKSTRRKP